MAATSRVDRHTVAQNLVHGYQLLVLGQQIGLTDRGREDGEKSKRDGIEGLVALRRQEADTEEGDAAVRSAIDQIDDEEPGTARWIAAEAVAAVGTSYKAVLSAIDIIEGEVKGAGRVIERATAARALAALDESGFKKFSKGGARRAPRKKPDATG